MSTLTMPKSAHLNVRMEPSLKEEGEAILSELGLSPTELVTLTYRQLVMRKGLPFDVRIPNAETISALEEDISNLKTYSSSSDLFEELDSE